MSERFRPTRRVAIIATAALVAAGAAGLEWGPRFFGRQYASTSFDDLLGKLNDREASAALGRVVVREQGTLDPVRVAASLRARLATGSISDLANSEARQGKIVEAGRWVVPESVMQMAALAALNTPPAS